MVKPVTLTEAAVGLVMCFVAGALCQHFMPLPLSIALRSTAIVAAIITIWRIWRQQGVGYSLQRGLILAVGWAAGVLLATMGF